GALALENRLPFLGDVPLEPLISKWLDEGGSFDRVKDEKGMQIFSLFLSLGRKVLSSIESSSSEKNTTPSIRSLSQTTPFNFKIEWMDGTSKNYRFADLQSLCPCARCIETRSQSPSRGIYNQE